MIIFWEWGRGFRLRHVIVTFGTCFRYATYGIKARCCWEHPWGTHREPKEHIETIMGTHWELEGNMLRTKEKWKKILPSTPPKTQNLKEKKSRHVECMLSLAIGCMKFLFPKLFITIFDLGQYPHYKLGALIH